MENNIIACFRTHYSLGRSTLTLDKYDSKIPEIKENAPVSICAIAKKHSLKEVFLIDSSFSGFIEAYENLSEIDVQLRFGVKLVVCDDINKKDDGSRVNESKLIVFLKNSNAYKDAIKIYSKAATDGFYYYPRIDWNHLKALWTENLLLAFPFYDSFLHNNLLTYKCSIVPDWGQIKPAFFVCEHSLPFDGLIKDAVNEYTRQNGLEVIKGHNVYYYSSSDYSSYVVFRCINNRSTLNKPDLEFFTSSDFSFESYLGKTNG